MSVVTQADREAAGPWHNGTAYGNKDKVGWMNGKYDHNRPIQAFAAHREETCAELVAVLERLLHDIDDLMSNSYGVDGLHQNGDVAPWSEIGEGGHFEPWIGEGITIARQAIAAYNKENDDA